MLTRVLTKGFDRSSLGLCSSVLFLTQSGTPDNTERRREANNFLRKRGLFPEDNDDDDDEMVFGDDDFPS